MLAPYVYAFVFVVGVFLLACRGEPVPRDYQNHPPGIGNSVDTSSQAPDASSEGIKPVPEPDSGVQGTSAPYETTTGGTLVPENRPSPRLPANSIVKGETPPAPTTAAPTSTAP